jgi:hypothetical protein
MPFSLRVLSQVKVDIEAVDIEAVDTEAAWRDHGDLAVLASKNRHDHGIWDRMSNFGW